MKMNPKASALGAMAEEGDNYKEPMNESEDNSEDMSEGEGGSAVKCHCGCDVVCKDCNMAPEDCNC
jgi:hypothetical protein